MSVPPFVRVSIGTAMAIGLIEGYSSCAPTTAYVLMYSQKRCSANCGFCSQASGSTSRGDRLSRVSWPFFATSQVLKKISRAEGEESLARICIQSVQKEKMLGELIALTRAFRHSSGLPISVCSPPLSLQQLGTMRNEGASTIGIPLDCVREDLFEEIRGSLTGSSYSWGSHRKALRDAVHVFGKGNVSTHLIVGLGETDRELVETNSTMCDMGVVVGLFAFTPLLGTALERRAKPSIRRYRRIQLARHLIYAGNPRAERITFGMSGEIDKIGMSKEEVLAAVGEGFPFMTTGCPSCNRPFFNETARGPLYNYPRPLTESELTVALAELDPAGLVDE